MRDSVTELAHKITEIPCHFAHSLCISGNFLVASKAAEGAGAQSFNHTSSALWIDLVRLEIRARGAFRMPMSDR